MIEQAFQVFGKNSFQNAIFYSNQQCLRFELSEGSEEASYVKMFTSALNKSTQIIDTIFEKSEEISICFAFPGDSYLSNFSVFKELKELQIDIPKNNFKLREWVKDDEWNRNYLFFNINKSELHKIIFGKLGTELGIKPSFWFDLYIYDINLGVLVHPYDDRGMDVVGTNKFMIKRLYKQYHSSLLDYDVNVMREWFGAL
ncbi:MAG: DUF3885 domain-containing protein [Moritella sp.]|uniref:DUF3885 domain-containing protein n=1 Tax=Moritella sp. TaxID=78556 RepID=UPI0025FE46D1|nr:DUF3885 domain-containing protein [Moritella sp.]NQZ90958.1 DUF3885 domain-containing protein [Moritella sp.]